VTALSTDSPFCLINLSDHKMRYTYEIFETVSGRRVDTGIRVELVKLKPGESIEITDNRNSKRITFLDQEELEEWLEAASRAYTWSDAKDKVIGQPVEAVLAGAYQALHQTGHSTEHLTLGQLKLDPRGARPLEDTNVKTAAAAGKPRVAAIPPIAIMALGSAMQTGADKYGYFNWRDTSVTATVFYNAVIRHMEQWFSGEDFASDTGVHHLAHAMAGCAIMLDAMMNDVFKDDRPRGVPLGDDYAKFFKRGVDHVR
jgi:hypothetical protein